MTEAQRLADHLERVWCDKESAAELRRLEAENDALQAKLRRSEALCREWAVKAATWMASPEAAQRLDGYRDMGKQIDKLEAECEQLRADAARLAYLFKHDSEWALCVFDHDGGYWIHDARTPDVVRADIDAAMKETK